MFTGIIEQVGTITRLIKGASGARLTIACHFDQLTLGESIAVNGICLTVIEHRHDTFCADASTETLARTNLGTLADGDSVNLERALRPIDRLGGHIVCGHVDGTATLSRAVASGPATALTFSAPTAPWMKYIVEKGSVAIDGASLTVNRVRPDGFDVMLIAHSRQTLFESFASPGRTANIEVDILGKYVEKLLSCKVRGLDAIHAPREASEAPHVSMDDLRVNGFL